MNLKDTIKYPLLIGLVAVLFLPFLVANHQFFPFITGKAFVFRILVEILFGIWIIGMFWDPSIRPKFSWIMGTVFLFIAIIGIADVFGVSPYRSFWSNYERMDGFISLIHLLVYFLVASSVLNTRLRWQTFFNVSVVASVIMSFYVFLQLAGKIVINQGGVRVDGTFGNATYLAAYMLLNFFLSLFLLVRLYQNDQSKRNWLVVGWYVLAMILQLISLYYTATRGAILGVVGGVVLSALIIVIFDKSKPVFRKSAIGVLVLVLVLVGGFFAIRNTNFAKQSPTISRFASLSIEEVSTQGRRYIWPMAFKGFLERPILGWGQENFNYVFAKYYDPKMYRQEPWFDRSHNIVLDWLTAGGILGLAGYLSIIILLLVSIRRSKNFSTTEKGILIGLVAAYFFQNLFVFDNLISYIYFFSLLAFVHSDRVKDKMESVLISRLAEKKLVSQRILPVAAVVLVAVSVYFLNVRQISANRSIITGIMNAPASPEASLEGFKNVFNQDTFGSGEAVEQMFNQIQRFTASDVKVETKTAFGNILVSEMDKQVEKFPTDARTLLFAGSLYNRLGNYPGAIKYLERAQQASPNKQSIAFELGFSHISQGENQLGLDQFKKAYESAPTYGEARMIYLIGAIYAKNDALIAELSKQLTEEQIATDERVIAAYVNTGRVDQAVKLLEKRVEISPKDAAVRFRLAAGYLSLNQRNRSIEVLRDAARLFPEVKDQAEFYIKEIQAGRNP